MRLRPKHFYKSDESKKKPGTLLDIYKACGLKGEDVYMHFYIDDVKGVLVVNSFKRTVDRGGPDCSVQKCGGEHPWETFDGASSGSANTTNHAVTSSW